LADGWSPCLPQTGEAYVEFSSPEDRERSMLKDRQHVGGRYVELFRVGRSEFHASLEQVPSPSA
jgi:hypothetical protein